MCDHRVDAARGARHDRARLVHQHDRRAVDVECLEDPVQQLAQQLLEIRGAKCRDGDRLHDPQPLGSGLGLCAGRLRADELLAVALGAPALAQVLQMQDQIRPPACGRARERGADEDRDRRPARAHEPPLHLVLLDPPRQQLLALLGIDAGVGARSELVERAPEQLPGAATEHLRERPVDVLQAPVGIRSRHPDRRILERRAQLRLALGERAAALVELAEDLDLRAQHDRIDRLEEVVHRAGAVTAKDVLGRLADRRDEDDRHAARALAGADQLGRLEAVEPRHLDVEEDRRELALQHRLERLLAGARPHEPVARRLEDRLEREQVLGVVVDEQDRRVAVHDPDSTPVAGECAPAQARYPRARAPVPRASPTAPRRASHAVRQSADPARSRPRRERRSARARARRRSWRPSGRRPPPAGRRRRPRS